MNVDRVAEIFARANPVSGREDVPDPVPAAELLSAAERRDTTTRPVAALPRLDSVPRRGWLVAGAALAIVLAVGIVVFAVLRSGGTAEQPPAVPSVVEVTGTSSCSAAEWIQGSEYTHECTLDMSDDRLSGSATWHWIVQLEGGTEGTYTGTVTIGNGDGTWSGSFTGTSVGSTATFTADLNGAGAYEGMTASITQRLLIDTQTGTLSGTIRPEE